MNWRHLNRGDKPVLCEGFEKGMMDLLQPIEHCNEKVAVIGAGPSGLAVADTLNRINLDMAKLNKRVQSNEEWVGSVNAFRRQINTSIAQLEASVRALQSAP